MLKLRALVHPLMALTMAVGMMTATMQDAEAGRGGRIAAGVAAGIVGLAILGAASRSRGGYYYDDYDDERCYRGRRRCHWSGRRCFENRYGDYVCRGGRYVCRRPLVCD